MAYTQRITPNVNITYTGGWCQKAVRNAYGQPAKYSTATAAWVGEPNKHYDRPPRGVAVPIYFALAGEPAGHVAISLADGRVASSSRAGTHKPLYIHASIEALIKYYATAYRATYLGWGEHISGVRVVQYVAPTAPAPKPKPTPPPAPKPAPAVVPQPAVESYRVKKNDTLGTIILQQGWGTKAGLWGAKGDVARIAKANGITNPNLIRVGQVIKRA